MSGYKLVYFPIRGRGERTRLAFAAAKIDFEDTRLPFEEWAKEKACKWIIDFHNNHALFFQLLKLL